MLKVKLLNVLKYKTRTSQDIPSCSVILPASWHSSTSRLKEHRSLLLLFNQCHHGTGLQWLCVIACLIDHDHLWVPCRTKIHCFLNCSISQNLYSPPVKRQHIFSPKKRQWFRGKVPVRFAWHMLGKGGKKVTGVTLTRNYCAECTLWHKR